MDKDASIIVRALAESGHLLAVGAGGFLGAVARYVLTGLVQRRFPAFTAAGTLLVNVLGCLIIGVLMELVVERTVAWPTLRLVLITGFLGSMTTFSAFGYETLELIEEREFRLALVNVAANLCLGLTAVWIGRSIVRAVL